MKFGLFILALFGLAGCNPIPIRSECEMPKFGIDTHHKVAKTFSEKSYFSTSCDAGVPEALSIFPSRSLQIDLRVRYEWVDMRALSNGITLEISNAAFKKYDFEGYSYMVRIDSLVDQRLTLEIPEHGEYSFDFSPSTCTCVSYDAI